MVPREQDGLRTEGTLDLWTNRVLGRAERGWMPLPGTRGLASFNLGRGRDGPGPGGKWPLQMRGRTKHAEGDAPSYLGPAPGLGLPSPS